MLTDVSTTLAVVIFTLVSLNIVKTSFNIKTNSFSQGQVARSLESVILWIAKIFKLVKKVFIFFLRQRHFVIFETMFYYSDCAVQIVYFSPIMDFMNVQKNFLSSG